MSATFAHLPPTPPFYTLAYVTEAYRVKLKERELDGGLSQWSGLRNDWVTWEGLPAPAPRYFLDDQYLDMINLWPGPLLPRTKALISELPGRVLATLLFPLRYCNTFGSARRK